LDSSTPKILGILIREFPQGVRPLEFDLRRGEDFFFPGQVAAGVMKRFPTLAGAAS
jgi:hypothetical protein